MNITSHDIATGAVGPGVSRVSVRGQFGFPDLAGNAIGFELKNLTSPCYIQKTDLSSGNNTITLPASAGGVVIMPPTSNTATLTLKGVNGDTGVKLHSSAPTLLTFDETVATFVLSASAAITDLQLAWL